MKKIDCLTAIAAVILLMAAAATPQTGSWIEYEFGSHFGTGSLKTVCGDNCIAYTYDQSSRILFFDTNSSAWLNYDLGATHTIHSLMPAGQHILVVTDLAAVLYDARTSTPQVLQYEGALLSTSFNNESYRCGRNLAVVVTDAKMYVYDAGLAAWQEYVYGSPPDFVNSGDLYANDDFVVFRVFRPYPAPYENVVYSRFQHAFNQETEGIAGAGDAFQMDRGYAGLGYQHADGWVLGYSAVTNEFAYHLAPGEAGVLHETVGDFPGQALATAFGASYVEAIEPGVVHRINLWGYDTRLGYLNYGNIEYDPNDVSYYTDWYRGGQFVLKGINDSGVLGILIYSGMSDAYSTYAPGLDYSSSTILRGGTFFVAGADFSALGYNLATGQSQVVALDHDDFTQSHAAGDYATFSRYSAADRMTTYIYHGPSNTWTTVGMPRNFGILYDVGERVFAFPCGYPDTEVLLYSAVLNSYEKVTFPAGTMSWGDYSDDLAAYWSDGQDYLYDARSGILHSFDYGYTTASLGGFVCVCPHDATQTLHGYSSLTGRWTSHAAGEDISVGFCTQFVGWGATRDVYTRYYAFNGFHDAWVPLEPQGSYAGSAQGAGIILVVRSDRIYAFDPEGTITPIFLAHFDLSPGPAAVTARWAISAVRDPADFRLVATSGQRDWPVNVRADPTGGFVAVDRSSVLTGGGIFNYSLYLRDEADRWQLLHSETVQLGEVPLQTQLLGARPNPFNPQTTIRFALNRPQHVEILICDVRGRKVAVLADERFTAGTHELVWRGKDDGGRDVASGTYLTRMTTETYAGARKLLLVR